MNKLIKQIEKALFYIKLYRLKNKANRYAKRYNAQFFIVKLHGKIVMISKNGFKELRQNGTIPLSITANELKKIAYYYTQK
jgi:hypothetical protein